MLNTIRMILHRFHRDEEGAAMVEYGLLIALIAAVAGVAVGTLGTTLATFFTAISTWLAGIPVPG